MGGKEYRSPGLVAYSEIGRAIELKAGQVFDYIGEIGPIEGVLPIHLHLLAVKKLNLNVRAAPFPDIRGHHEEAIIRVLESDIEQLGNIKGKGTREVKGNELDSQLVYFGNFIFEREDGEKEEIIFLPTKECGEEKYQLLQRIDTNLRTGCVLQEKEGAVFLIINPASGDLTQVRKDFLERISRQEYNDLFGAKK